MKKILIILTIIAAPWYLSAQTMTIEDGAEVKIGLGASMTTGPINNAATTAGNGLIIESSSSGTGSLIASGTPTATVQRYVISGRWNMLSPSTSGVTGQTFFDASGNDSWLTYYDEATGTNGGTDGQGWTYLTTLNDAVNVGQGYSYWPSVGETVEFKGDLQTADLSPTIYFTGATHGYNLIGNPFSSALLWDASWTMTNVESTIWIWNGAQYEGAASGVNPRDIPVGQGFFVRADASGPGITIPASKRLHSTQTFLKNGQEITANKFNHLIVNAQNNQYEDKVFIYFDDSGTDDFDNGFDATKMFGLAEAPQLYLVENDWRQSNDFLPNLEEGEERTVAMSYIAGAAGEQKLIADFSYFSGAEVILEDNKTGQIQNLKENNVYNFSGSKEDSPERFLLHFAWSPDGIGEDFEQVSNIQIYSYGNDVYICSDRDAINQTGEVFIYDLMGNKLLQQTVGKGELQKLSVKINSNYVVVKVVKEGFAKTEMIFIK